MLILIPKEIGCVIGHPKSVAFMCSDAHMLVQSNAYKCFITFIWPVRKVIYKCPEEPDGLVMRLQKIRAELLKVKIAKRRQFCISNDRFAQDKRIPHASKLLMKVYFRRKLVQTVGKMIIVTASIVGRHVSHVMVGSSFGKRHTFQQQPRSVARAVMKLPEYMVSNGNAVYFSRLSNLKGSSNGLC